MPEATLSSPGDTTEPTSAAIREWEDSHKRGHSACAEHFRANGYPGLTEDRVRELYRQGGAAGAKPGSGKSRARAKETGEGGTTPASPEANSAPRHGTEAPPAPSGPESPAAALVHLPTPAGPEPEPGTLAWRKRELARLMQQREDLPKRDGQAYAQLSRSIDKAAEWILEMQAAENAKSATTLTAEQRVKRLREQVAGWPLLALRVVVEEFLLRTKLTLYDPRDGGRVLDVGEVDDGG